MSALTFNTNISALRIRRYLDRASAQVRSGLEKLGSGERINRASDDAAGLGISSLLRRDSRVFGQGIRNANDVISAGSIASQALGQLSTIVTRIKELATQSANGTLSSTQRSTLDQEGQQLRSEYNRIIGGTVFNGMHIFNATSGDITAQVGYGESATISLNATGEIDRRAGNGTFSSSSVTATSADGFATQLVDIDGDGDEDAVYVDDNLSNNVYALKNNGDGTFASATLLTTTLSALTGPVALADLDGDGDKDLVAGSSGGNLITWTNNGSGTFASAVTVSTGLGLSITEIAVGDINGDGKEDLVASANLSPSSKVLLADGQASRYTGSTSIASISSVTLADFNGDGYDDIAGVTATGGVNLYQSAAGVISTGPTSQLTVSGAVGVESGDIDGDSDLDLVVLQASGATLSTFLSQAGTVSTTAANSYSISTAGGQPRIADVNGDGAKDIVFRSSAGTTLYAMYGTGSGSFDPAVSMWTGAAGTALGTIATADLNNDGLDDVYGGSTTGAQATFVQPGSELSANMRFFSLTSTTSALDALSYMDTLLQNIDLQISKLGSAESRLQTAVGVLFAQKENSEAADARITDADVAQESANLTRNQIVQSLASSLLAQANVAPKIALSLLQGASSTSRIR